MANPKKNQNLTSYTYESVDGTTSTIKVGQDGVTREMIVLLQQDDQRKQLIALRKQLKTKRLQWISCLTAFEDEAPETEPETEPAEEETEEEPEEAYEEPEAPEVDVTAALVQEPKKGGTKKGAKK